MIWSDFTLYNRLDMSLGYPSIVECLVVSSLRSLRLCVPIGYSSNRRGVQPSNLRTIFGTVAPRGATLISICCFYYRRTAVRLYDTSCISQTDSLCPTSININTNTMCQSIIQYLHAFMTRNGSNRN